MKRQNIWRIDPEVRSEKSTTVCSEFRSISDEFLFSSPPSKIGIGLLKSNFTESVHHCWTSKSFRQENYFGMFEIDHMNQFVPKLHRFGMWIIDSKYFDSFRNPKRSEEHTSELQSRQ